MTTSDTPKDTRHDAAFYRDMARSYMRINGQLQADLTAEREKNAKLREEQGWIPVVDKLPEGNKQKVLLWMPINREDRRGVILFGHQDWQQGWSPDYWQTDQGPIDFKDITMWKPVEPPSAP